MRGGMESSYSNPAEGQANSVQQRGRKPRHARTARTQPALAAPPAPTLADAAEFKRGRARGGKKKRVQGHAAA